MNHLADIDLIELAGGQLPESRRQACDAHLGQCAECRERQQAIASTWQRLGDWAVDVPAGDLSAEVLATLASEQRMRIGAPASKGRLAIRVAASVALAVGAGHLAGRWMWTVPSTVAVAPASEEQVIESLQLNELGGQAAADLAQSLVDGPDQDEKESEG